MVCDNKGGIDQKRRKDYGKVFTDKEKRALKDGKSHISATSHRNREKQPPPPAQSYVPIMPYEEVEEEDRVVRMNHHSQEEENTNNAAAASTSSMEKAAVIGTKKLAATLWCLGHNFLQKSCSCARS